MLANVPLVITASFPLRAPYELNSRGVSLRNKFKVNNISQYQVKGEVFLPTVANCLLRGLS